MKLARKITLALVLGIVAVMGVHAWLEIRREVVLFEADIRAPQRRGQALLATLRNVWATEGEARVRALVDDIGAALGNFDVRWVPLPPPAGDPAASHLTPAVRQRLAEGEVVRLVVPEGADGMMVRHVYVQLAPDADVVLEATEPLEQEMHFVSTSRWGIVLATVMVVLVCALIAVALQLRFVGLPVAMLRDQARRIGSGDLSHRLGLRQRDEIGELAAEMDALCDRLAEANRRLAEEAEARVAALDQLRHRDRLATVGQLAAGIAHELGTPLNVIAARAGLLATGDVGAPEVADHARIIQEQATRMTAIIRQLLDFSRRSGAHLETADVRQVVARTCDLLAATARERRVTITRPAPGPAVVARIDPGQVQQALANVIVNGIQAMPNGGRLAVDVSTCDAGPPAGVGGAPGTYACITVQDAGAGMSPDDVARMFEPFFTTKPIGEGTGLGLSVAHGIVEEHGGWFEVDSRPGEGTRVVLFLPLAGADAMEAAS